MPTGCCATLGQRLKTRLRAPDLRRHLAILLSAWLGQPVPRCDQGRESLQSFLIHRLEELAEGLLAGSPSEGLLALPEYHDGRLSAATLCERLDGLKPSVWDFTQALLRLSPDLPVPDGLADLSGEPARAIEHALGRPTSAPRVTPVWWQAGDLLRQASEPADWKLEVRVQTHLINGKTYHYRTLVIPELAWRDGAGLHWEDLTEDAPSLRWQALISPALRESFQLLGIEQIANNLDWWAADWSDRVYLESLLDPAERWGRCGALLACFGLGCKEAGQKGIAMDAVAEGVASGRLSAATLGTALTEAADTGMITARRWAACFEQLRGFVRLDVLFEALQSLFAEHQGPTDLRPLLGPFLEIAVEGGGKLRDPRARQSLQDFSGGKAGGQARRLLAL